VGTEIPVGDPLTPEGGPGRAELRLEEEEEVEEEEKVEEEEEAERGVQEEVSGTPSSSSSTGGWELFGHLLVEDTTRPGRYSLLKCVRCGVEASLLDLKTLKNKPCVAVEEKREVVVSLPRKCENCGREATATLCDTCATVFESYATTARPAPLRGRGGVKPPSIPGVDGWGWVTSLTTFFPFRNLEGVGREWWCPACKKTFKRLIDAADHFREAHPFEASRGWYEEFDVKSKRVRLRNWQGWVDEQQLQLILESEVKPQ
jgi:uncharacterized C2H2 Zn-finger protein